MRATYKLAVAATFMVVGQAQAETYISAKQLLTANPSATSGFYEFDPDGTGGEASFITYADMTTAGGGWTLGMGSYQNSITPSTDIALTIGTASPTTGYVRDLSPLAIDATAQLRHRIVGYTGLVLFDGYYTGTYYGALTFPTWEWTVLQGSFSAAGLDYHIGADWSTISNDVDDSFLNCASISGGQGWYYRSCFAAHPGYAGYQGPSGPIAGPLGSFTPALSYEIFVREIADYTQAVVPEPAGWTMMIVGFGAVGYSLRRRRSAASFSHA